MQCVFVEFWITLEIILYDVYHGHRHFVFGIEVKPTYYTFHYNKRFSKKSCILRGRIDDASVAF